MPASALLVCPVLILVLVLLPFLGNLPDGLVIARNRAELPLVGSGQDLLVKDFRLFVFSLNTLLFVILAAIL